MWEMNWPALGPWPRFKRMPVDSYIGISGQRVKPGIVYWAKGFGQIHHLSGLVRQAGISHDEQAPIFELLITAWLEIGRQ